MGMILKNLGFQTSNMVGNVKSILLCFFLSPCVFYWIFLHYVVHVFSFSNYSLVLLLLILWCASHLMATVYVLVIMCIGQGKFVWCLGSKIIYKMLRFEFIDQSFYISFWLHTMHICILMSFCKFCNNGWIIGQLDNAIHVNLNQASTFEIITLNLNHIKNHIHFNNLKPYS
jgi:hypothetical protein